jgi:hypothetical protein
MSQSRDDDGRRTPYEPRDQLANKLDAFRSERLQALARDILIIESRHGDGNVLSSLLRALFGRHVEARRALGLDGGLQAIAASLPNLIIWRDSAGGSAPAQDGVRQLGLSGFTGPIVVVIDHLSAPAAIRLRKAGALDVIENDELNSVRLSQALHKAVDVDPPASWTVASLS